MNMLLLDFDGVVFHNPYVYEYVGEKSIDYVKVRSRIPLNEAVHVSKVGYEKYGHTSLIYGNKPNLTHSYNYHVFNKNKTDLIKLISKSVSRKNKQHVHDMLMMKQMCNYEYVLCTNTPKWYCEHVLRALETSYEEMFCCDVSFTSDSGLLKPCKDYFDNVEKHLQQDEYIFIDDSILNIQGIQTRPNWNGHHVRNETEVLKTLELISDVVYN